MSRLVCLPICAEGFRLSQSTPLSSGLCPSPWLGILLPYAQVSECGCWPQRAHQPVARSRPTLLKQYPSDPESLVSRPQVFLLTQ